MLSAVIAGTLVSMAVAQLAPAWPALAKLAALADALPPWSWPDLRIDTVRSLFGATLVMTLLALTEATAIAKAVARRNGDRLDGNQEFIGQGLANLAGSFFSSCPASGSFNRSGVNVEAGARTPLAAVFAAWLPPLPCRWNGRSCWASRLHCWCAARRDKECWHNPRPARPGALPRWADHSGRRTPAARACATTRFS